MHYQTYKYLEMRTCWNSDTGETWGEFDERVFLKHLAQNTPYLRKLLDEFFYIPDEYKDFLREKLRV